MNKLLEDINKCEYCLKIINKLEKRILKSKTHSTRITLIAWVNKNPFEKNKKNMTYHIEEKE